MNGYEKMKRLRKMKILKGISAATALSMTVTGLAVAASANPATPDKIAEALGGLTRYGIVAESLETYSHFESNFAVKNAQINNNFDLNNAVRQISRNVMFAVTSEESFEQGEEKNHYFGIFSDGERVGEIVCVKFTEQGTKEFTISIPEEYKYKDLIIHQLKLVSSEDGKAMYETVDEGIVLYAEAGSESELMTAFGSCIVSDTLTAGCETLSHDKVIYVGSELFGRFKQAEDGRWYLGEPVYEQKQVTDDDGIVTYADVIKLDDEGNPIYRYPGAPVADRTTAIIEMVNAAEAVDELIATIQSASDKLASYTNNLDGNVIRLAIETDSYVNDAYVKDILKDYDFLRNNPDYILLVDVKIKPGENSLVFNSGSTWDADVASRAVFNFHGSGTNPENTHITIGDGFLGTIVAPTARVSNASSFCGAVYAPKVTLSSGEPHRATYRTLVQPYSAFFADEPAVTTPEQTTPEEVTTVPEITTVPEQTTTPEETTVTTVENSTEAVTTVPEETTSEATAPEETTVTTVENSTEKITTPPEETTVTTITELTTTTAPPPVETTTPEVTTTTTEATTPAPVETTPAPAETTSAPVETTPAPVETTPVPVETTTPPPVETTAANSEEIATTLAETTPAPVVTTSDDVTVPTESEPEPEETTADATVPEETPEVTTTVITIEIDENVPRDNLIIIDEDVPLGDMPPSTGVESSVGMFIAIGCGALAIGIGAQVYSVLLKKKN